MKKIKHSTIPIGIDSFDKLRINGCYYVDKTGFIEELLNDTFEVNLITRPRRFGKTLNMSMLAAFFDIKKDSKAIFDGLKVSRNKSLCDVWMNQSPVLFLTLKSVEGLDFDSAYAMLAAVISDICIANYDLLQSHEINEIDKRLFMRLAEKTASSEEIKNSLYVLSRMMRTHYGKPVILLIDEYDVPLAGASERAYYTPMLDLIKGLLGKALKGNESLKFAVITGCLRIAKESIFTGTNNFVSNSISNDRYGEYFGFTESEVAEMLRDMGFADRSDVVKTWYDGYRFGSTEIYCPWDVLNYIIDLQVSPNAKPGNYWKNTSHNGIIRSFIDRTDLMVNEKFEILLSGGYIKEVISEDLTYDVLHSSESNLWSILYLTGYLTQTIPIENKESPPSSNEVFLKIPNEEIKNIFAETVAIWFSETVQTLDRGKLFEAFWNGNVEKASRMVTDILFDTISYYDYKEDYYHAFLAGLFSGAGYAVESNKEYGLGRPDIVIRDRKNRRVIIIEVKHSRTNADFEKDCETALDQIDVKSYAYQFLKGYHTILCYGAAFCDKECMIKATV